MKLNKMKTILTVVALGASFITMMSDAHASGCHRSRYRRPVYYHPPRPAVCPQPVRPVLPIDPQVELQPSAPRPELRVSPQIRGRLQVQGQQLSRSVRPAPAARQALASPAPATSVQRSIEQPRTSLPAQAAAPQTAPTNQAELSALQALAGFASSQPRAAETQPRAGETQPQSDAPAEPAPPSHVGTWNASLPNGTSVELILEQSGSFSWIATNKSGSQKSFSGTYSVGGGSLTLIRSNDSQKLAGIMTSSNSDGFNFKLGGKNDPGLNFVRG